MKTSEMQVTLLEHMGSDLSVVNAARVSFDKQSDWAVTQDASGNDVQAAGELNGADTKRVYYLSRNGHTSPFNHASAWFRVKAPIFVARQLVKHKFLPWNEVSRRYVDTPPEFYVPEAWRLRAENVKQGSSEEVSPSSEYITSGVQRTLLHALDEYEYLLAMNICPEQARIVLPQCTMTEWVWSGTLGAWADMCRLRLDAHAQLETKQIAAGISVEMKRLFPVSWAALLEEKTK